MLVLVAGGPAAGKATVCNELARFIGSEDPEIVVHNIDMKKWHKENYGPNNDFEACRNYIKSLDSSSIILLHGKYALYDPALRSMAQTKVFVDTDSDEQLSQWLLRDKDTRDINEILNEYLNFARKEFIEYISDTKEYADVLLPKAKDSLGLGVIAANLVDKLKNVDDGSYSLRKEKKIDLRKELFEEMDSRYYAAS